MKPKAPKSWKETGMYTPSVHLTKNGNVWFEESWYDLENVKRLHAWLTKVIRYLEDKKK